MKALGAMLPSVTAASLEGGLAPNDVRYTAAEPHFTPLGPATAAREMPRGPVRGRLSVTADHSAPM